MARAEFGGDSIRRPFVWIWSLAVLVHVCIGGTEAQNPDSDAMLAIRSSLISNDTSVQKFQGWNDDSTPYCEWEGVSCDSDGAVSNITLSTFLGGSLPEEVGNLAGLEILHLTFCSLEGSIPKSLSKLRNLRILDLSENNLSGTIPSLGDLTNLILLSFKVNNLEGSVPSLKGLSNLTVLNLAINELTGNLPDEDLQNSAIEILDLSVNNLSGRIPVIIGRLVSLTKLDLSFNSLEGVIPDMESLVNLKALYLESNHLEGTIPSMKGILANLTLISLGFNRLTGGFPDWDWENSPIETIIFNANNISGSLPDGLMRLPKLEALDLSSNKLEGPIPAFERFANISLINLSDNRLTGEISGWNWNGGDWERSSLLHLDLSKNQIGGTIPGALLLNLQGLDLSSNIFRALDMGARADGHYVGYPRYGGSSSLRYLDLSRNPLQSDNMSYSFPGQAFGRLHFPELLELRLDDIRLSGDIRAYLFDFFTGDLISTAFPKLRVLQCAGNNMSGVLKLTWRHIGMTDGKLLEILDLSRNPNLSLFYTPATETSFLQILLLGRFPFLHELRLSNMNSTGVMPPRVGYLKFLEVLDLSHNSLGGAITDQYSNNTLPSLVLLDLSDNRVGGEIPQSLTSLDLLLTLDLSHNRFSGQVPSFLNPDDAGRAIKRFRFNASSFLGNDGLCGAPLPPCAVPPVRKTHTWALFFRVVCVSSVTATCCLVLAWQWTIRVYCKRDPQDVDLMQVLSENATPMMSLKSLKRATENFADRRKIGPGGWGGVYWGTLDDGTQVAVKTDVHHGGRHGGPDKKRFLNEVKVLSQVNHKNLVKLLGCCRSAKLDALVFEFVSNGTLLQHLRQKQQPLSWTERLLIAVQTADALAYLHSSASPPIYHLDVKSANILLTASLHAKVADFGISKLAPREGTRITKPAGTPGYMDPEYFASCKPTDKSDVFSFGVVLLELISGQPVMDFGRSFDNPGLVSFALPLILSGDLGTLVDPSLSQSPHYSHCREEVRTVASLAAMCLREHSKDRPTMKEVWSELHSVRASSSSSWQDYLGIGREVTDITSLDPQDPHDYTDIIPRF